ncbi:Gti1/Pac2 family-domain-containing protein [Cristinia sonorae]|uniref:Gti1/Pac2 family-domain-containing protein n=1 Tax=Cristinia sonorae TaxID=1940300 RepID=A0A8K0XUU8_9AGAR|nr:Gti1/Pac2 family-domain-containing protein [Cristinia sonorae]
MAQAHPPTFTGIAIHSIDEANRLFHVVRLGKAKLFTRRLSVEERRAIYTGCVFVWEERNPTLEATGEGIERWTDGRRWSCSRTKTGFLYYSEKMPEIADPIATAALSPNRLVKQTYSVWVDTLEGRRKWHLVAYYTEHTHKQLGSVDEIIRRILGGQAPVIPVDAYQPARQPKGGRNRQEEADDDDAPLAASSSDVSRDEPPRTPPSSSLEAKLIAVVDLDNLKLPEIQQPLPSRDPLYILHNCVAMCPDIYQAQNRGLLAADTSKDLAPLVYMRKTPYTPRHPLDNDALRSCDANSRWLSA